MVLPLIPYTSSLHVMAIATFLLPGEGAIAAICSGYMMYQACSTYRDAFLPQQSGDHYNLSACNILDLTVPSMVQFSLILHAKLIGIFFGIFLSLIFWLFDYTRLTSLSFSYIILLGVCSLAGYGKSFKQCAVIAFYLLSVSVIFHFSNAYNVVNPVLALGCAFFTIPTILMRGKESSLFVLPSKVYACPSPKMVGMNNIIGLSSAFLTAIAPGVSSSAIGSSLYTNDESKGSIHTSELAAESMGMFFALLGSSYGSSLINIEILVYDEPLSLGLGFGFLALLCFFIGSFIAKNPAYTSLARSFVHSHSLSVIALIINTALLIYSSGFLSFMFLGLGLINAYLIQKTESPSSIRSFTFLGALLPF